MRHQPAADSSASAPSPDKDRAKPQPYLRARTAHIDAPPTARSPIREPCGSAVEIHSRMPETQPQPYSVVSVKRRYAAKAERWATAAPDTAEYPPHRAQPEPSKQQERSHRRFPAMRRCSPCHLQELDDRN